MDRIVKIVVALSLLMVSPLLFVTEVSSETEEVRKPLETFMEKLSSRDVKNRVNWGWNSSSDPCNDKWKGVECVGNSIKKIILKNSNLTGVLDASLLCVTSSLFVLSLENNNISGELPDEISNCTRLTHVYLQGNNFSGELPASLSKLSSLKRIVASNNRFSGHLPEMSGVTGLLTFRAQFNDLSGQLPSFDFASLEEFNVSYNNLSGQISPNFSNRFDASSFIGNPALCGIPLLNACSDLPPSPPIQHDNKGSSAKQYVIYTGYGILGLVVVFLFALRIVTIKKKKVVQDEDKTTSSTTVDISRSKYSGKSSESSKMRDRSEYSIITSSEGVGVSPFVILGNNQIIGDLSFEELLSAPAELKGRGKHGSTYQVTLSREGVILAVKRIKDWGISRDEFEKRIRKIDQVKHGNVLPVLGYYCSKIEKLLVYEYQQNGSLFSLLHESGKSEIFDWEKRLDMAASIAEALAFMHERLDDEGIAHGNLKSSNILLLNNSMNNSCISEYGLMVVANNDQRQSSEVGKGKNSNGNSTSRNLDPGNAFKADIYGYGVILLELLTGKVVVQSIGLDLARWVHSVIREECTADVFDKKLIADGASELKMVNLLQVALKCLDSLADARPNMREIAIMINSIKEDEVE